MGDKGLFPSTRGLTLEEFGELQELVRRTLGGARDFGRKVFRRLEHNCERANHL